MKDHEFAKLVLFVNGLVPAALLGWDAYYHHLGADPTIFAIRTTGMLGLIFLTLSLAVTPLRKITGFSYLSHFRRTLGLYAFFYAALHFLTYFAFDRSLGLASTIRDVAKRPFILVGMTGLLAMAPLAITSTNAMIKRLGAARWKRLHKLAYLAAVAGVTHYYLLVKADTRQPLAFAGVVAVLLGYRAMAARFPAVNRKANPRGSVPVLPAARSFPSE